jgi:hypothetical protein
MVLVSGAWGILELENLRFFGNSDVEEETDDAIVVGIYYQSSSVSRERAVVLCC